MKSTGSLLTASFDGQYNKWSYARILDSVNSIDKDYHIELHRSTMVNTVIHVLNRYVSELNGASESFPRGIINMRGARKGVISGINFR
jgi:molybdenum cofactor biosynthesis enzyme MoaA